MLEPELAPEPGGVARDLHVAAVGAARERLGADQIEPGAHVCGLRGELRRVVGLLRRLGVLAATEERIRQQRRGSHARRTIRIRLLGGPQRLHRVRRAAGQQERLALQLGRMGRECARPRHLQILRGFQQTP